MAFMFQLLLAGFILLARLVRWGYRRLKAVPLDPSRRRMLTHAAAYPLAAAAAAVYGGVDERVHQVVREHPVPIAGQATGLDGFRIAQLSDVHLGLFFSLPMLRELAKADERVKYISFSRNFGKEAAMYAGLQHAKGDFVCVMDADLQDPP